MTPAEFYAQCQDCDTNMKFRLESNRNAWIRGHEQLTARDGEQHQVARSDNLPGSES
ncbi:hypothetical protein GTQ99_00455 [Kineococcus sp. T13]|uniref:hypothetical protein n=1 Tax=Kineococcus vitellinus TaxID=2696565 RepID=UPI001412E9F2|nr:hypothetical protein [Kineococcus vitellinus]NAZ73902.1 hypothetical protein [Kineococcus vitellinus]